MAFIAFSLTGEALGQKFETSASEQFFKEADHSPKSVKDKTIHDLVEEATGAVTHQIQDGKEGAQGVRYLVQVLRNYSLPFMLILAVMSFILGGIRLVLDRKDAENAWKERLKKAVYTGIGLMIITASILVVDKVFFGTAGEFVGIEKDDGKFLDFGKYGYSELKGIVDFVASLTIALGVLMVVISSIQLILGGQEEENLNKLKKRIIWGIVGLLVVFLAKYFIIEKYFFPEVAKGNPVVKVPDTKVIIKDWVAWVAFALGYVALFGVVALLVSAIYMIVNFGDEDKITKGKNVIKWVVIGLIITFSAWTITYYFSNPIRFG